MIEYSGDRHTRHPVMRCDWCNHQIKHHGAVAWGEDERGHQNTPLFTLHDGSCFGSFADQREQLGCTPLAADEIGTFLRNLLIGLRLSRETRNELANTLGPFGPGWTIRRR